MTDNLPLTIPADVLKDCYLERWNVLAPERREAVAAELARALTADGHAFTDWRFEAHGPDGEQTILIFTDARSRLDFALIPGGTLLPGYDAAQLRRYRKIYAADAPPGFWDVHEEDEAYGRQPDACPTVFASAAPCDLRRKDPVVVAPLLMAVTPLLAGTPGIAAVMTLPAWRQATWAERAAHHYPFRLRWETVAPVTEHYRWALPTTQEWEWACQGGTSAVFYWGDDVPRFVVNPVLYYADGEDEEEIERYTAEAWERDAEIALLWPESDRALVTDAVEFEDVMEMHFPPERPRRWPYANRFGLIGLLALGQWCQPSGDPDDPHPLIVRGGAAEGFPWQGCHEWLRLLRAAECRLDKDATRSDWNTLRPVVRFGQASGPANHR